MREILFSYKKAMDQRYRNIMYHLALGGNCDRCKYWDEVYKAHQAQVELDKVPPSGSSTEVKDEEMLELAESMEVDGTH